MSGVLERSFKMLEYLSEHPEGVPVSVMAAALQIPLSASHRLLSELIHFGSLRHPYTERMKIISPLLSFYKDEINLGFQHG